MERRERLNLYRYCSCLTKWKSLNKKRTAYRLTLQHSHKEEQIDLLSVGKDVMPLSGTKVSPSAPSLKILLIYFVSIERLSALLGSTGLNKLTNHVWFVTVWPAILAP